MPDTFQAAIVVAVALVPGALYFWAFERQAGRWGVALADRLLRFVGLSAVFHAAIAPVSYWFWANEWPKLSEGDPVSLWLWGVAIAYVATPVAGGTIIGYATRLGLPWSRWFAGPHAAPRAWDYFFEHGPLGCARMRLKSGTWIAGAYAEINGRQPYSAGYPEAQDLYLPAAVDVDPVTGELPYDENGHIVHRPGALLVRWDEVEYLEFFEEPWRADHGQSRTAPPSPPEGVRRRLHLFRQGVLGVEPARRARSGRRGKAPRSRRASRQEEVGKRRRKEFVGGYTASGRHVSELKLRGVPGPGPGEERGRTPGG
jgi:hypothetical protein